MGCYASHLGVLGLFAATGQPLALVSEDDVEFRPGFTRILDNIDKLPDRLDILRLSNPETGIRIKLGTIANGMEIIKYWNIPANARAYIVSRSRAWKIIGNDKLRCLPYDHAIGEAAYIFGLNSFGIHPAPVRHTEERSSIDREAQRPEPRDKTCLQSIARPRLIRHPLMSMRRFFHRMKEWPYVLQFRYKLRKRKIRHFQRKGIPINEPMFLIEYGSGYALKDKQVRQEGYGRTKAAACDMDS